MCLLPRGPSLSFVTGWEVRKGMVAKARARPQLAQAWALNPVQAGPAVRLSRFPCLRPHSSPRSYPFHETGILTSPTPSLPIVVERLHSGASLPQF